MTAVSAPDPQTLVVETDFPNALILQAYVPILPKHIWAEHYDRGDRRPGERELLQERAAGRRDRPVPGSRVGARRLHPLRPQPQLLGRAGRRRRDHPAALRQRRHDGPGAQDRRRRLRPRRPRPISSTPSRQSRTSPPSKASPTATPSSRSTPAATRRATAGRPRPSPTSRSATRSATPSTSRRSSTRPRWLRHAGLDDHPAVPHPLARRARDPAPVRPRRGQPPPRCRRLHAGRPTASASTRTATSSTCA